MVIRENLGADVVAFDHEGKAIFMAEIKRLDQKSKEWAARYRDNILARDTRFDPEFLLIVTWDQAFLWTKPGRSHRNPEIVFPTQELLAPHLERMNVRLQDLSRGAFESVATARIDGLSWEDLPLEHPLHSLSKALSAAELVVDL